MQRVRKRRLAMVISRRTLLIAASASAALGAGGYAFHVATRFPPDTTPEGAYRRIAHSLSRGKPHEIFSYLEEDAIHATFSMHGYAREIVEAVRASYPEGERAPVLARYERLSKAEDPAALWVMLAEERGFLRQLRRDLSGIDHVERSGERATVVTARGTRYALRVRPNGIWGLSMFTAQLDAEARRLARDWDAIRRAAHDFRAGARPASSAGP